MLFSAQSLQGQDRAVTLVFCTSKGHSPTNFHQYDQYTKEHQYTKSTKGKGRHVSMLWITPLNAYDVGNVS